MSGIFEARNDDHLDPQGKVWKQEVIDTTALFWIFCRERRDTMKIVLHIVALASAGSAIIALAGEMSPFHAAIGWAVVAYGVFREAQKQ